MASSSRPGRSATAATPRAEQEAWIRSRVDATGPIEEVAAQPWALVLRVPTLEGRLYFKEPAAQYAHEARVIELLARRRPDLVPEIVASDEGGRILMRDAGEKLYAILVRDLDLRYWLESLQRYAELQLAVAADADALLAAGAFDRRLARVPDLYHEIVEVRLDGQTRDEHARLRGLYPEVVRSCEQLQSLRVPETVQIDDLTSANVFLDEGRYRFVDWGFACVSHPFFTLAVTQRAIERRFGLGPRSKEIERVRDAYLEPFAGFAGRNDLKSGAEIARRFGQICRVALRAEASWKNEQGDLASTLRFLLDPDGWQVAAQ